MSLVALAHEERKWNHIGFLVVGLVVYIFLRIPLDTLNFVAGNKYISRVFFNIKSLLHEVVSHAVHLAIPLVFCSELFLFSDFKLVRVCITKQGIHAKLVFKEHGESFHLPGEINENLLAS
jgi:hypothetical protein